MAKLSARGRYTVAEATKLDIDGNIQVTRRLMSDGTVLSKIKYLDINHTSGWKVAMKTIKTPDDWIIDYNHAGWQVKPVSKSQS